MILITAAALVGYALRERSSGFALAGQLVLNAGATAGYLLAISKGGLVFDASQWIRLAQLNAGKGMNETYLPFVVGDGSMGALRLCRYSGWTSLLRPRQAALCRS